MNDKVNIISIPVDKQIELTIGGLFYQRLNKLFIEYADSQGKETLLSAIEKIKQQQSQTDDFTYNLETLIILIRDIEEKFKSSNQVNSIDVESEDIQKIIQENLSK